MARISKILFLVSGNGGTLKCLHQSIPYLASKFQIVAAISDRDCGAIDYMRNNGIPTLVFKDWKHSEDEVAETIASYNPDVVVTNIHKVLSKTILLCNNAKYVNLHYSLLPSYGGVIGFKTLEMAKNNNAKIIGATCHYVTEVLDGGSIISQGAMAVDWNDNIEAIGNSIFRIACKVFLSSLIYVANEKSSCFASRDGNLYSPQLSFDDSFMTEDFWQLVANL